MERIPIGGLAAQDADELCPLERAVEASNCIVDDGAVRGRPAYRSLAATAVGTGQVQFLGRHRISPSEAKYVIVDGGEVRTLTDPSTLYASDGTIALLGAPFGATARISGAPLSSDFYLGSDEAGVPWQRITSAWTLEALENIPQGDKPAVSAFPSLAWTLFKDLSAPTLSSGITMQSGTSGLATNWRAMMNAAGTGDPASGETALFKLGADFDSRSCAWLAIAITPYDSNDSKGQVDIALARDNAGSPADLTIVGNTHDVPPIAGSPNLVYVPLDGVPSAVRSAVRYIKLTLTGSNGGRFGIYGYIFLPSRDVAQPVKYYVTFYNGSTGQESVPTDELDVTVTDANVVLPTYPECFLDNHAFKSPSGASDDMLSTGNHRIYNREAGLAMPDLSELGATVTITGTTPAVTGPTLVRLWKDTSDGRRLVGTVAYPGASSAYSITDHMGLSILSSDLFRAGGTPPPCVAMASWAGRLICARGRRIYVSSFTPVSDTTDPVPQFPALALEEADGWAFDIASSDAEFVQMIVAGDGVYILTQKNCRMLFSLKPGTEPEEVLDRGVVSRRGALYAESMLFWGSWDGVYSAQGRASVQELTQEVRRLYIGWLQPDSTLQIGYKHRTLWVVVGRRYMRYSFTARGNPWTIGTLSHDIAGMVSI